MSDSYRNGAFALGLVTGSGIAINLFLWLAYQSNKARESIAQSQEDTQKNQEMMRPWDWSIETFVSPSDTVAQWAMALLSLVAVYLLWETLKSSRNTLKATQDMAVDTRNIGKAQTRAYLSVGETSIKWIDGCKYDIEIVVQNRGQTPAHKMRFAGGFIIGHSAHNAAPYINVGGKSSVAVLSPGERFYITHRVTLPELANYDDLEDWFGVTLSALVSYKDAFGAQRRTLYSGWRSIKDIAGGATRMHTCTKHNSAT